MKTIEKVGAITPRDKDLLLRLKETVRGLIPSAELLVYGSTAKGTRGMGSDYDILVLTDIALSTKEENDVSDAIYELELSDDVVISTIFYPKNQWNTPLAEAMPFHKRIEEEAVLL